MYKVEIITVVGIFTATTPEEVNREIDITGAGDYIAGLAENGAYVELDDLSVVRFKDPSVIKAYRVIDDPGVSLPAREEQTGAAPEPLPKPWQGATGNIHTWKEKVNYTGTQYNIVVLSTWDADSRAFFLLFTINGAAARDMISDSGQAKMLAAWLEQNYQYKGQYEVVVPHGTVYDQDEAEAYLKDYVRETAPEYKPKEKTGKAWQGWNKDK